MTKQARRSRQSANAAAICGRSFFLPDSISVNSPTSAPRAPATCRETASRCASRPSPEAPYCAVDTLGTPGALKGRRAVFGGILSAFQSEMSDCRIDTVCDR
jgi:hypothetical protein